MELEKAWKRKSSGMQASDKKQAMKIDMIVERTKTGYSAYAEHYPVYTAGKTLDELKGQIVEALNLFFEKDGKSVTVKDLKIQLDFITQIGALIF